MNDERLCKIALNTVPFIGPVTFHRLIAAFGSVSETLQEKAENLSRVERVSRKMADQILRMDPISVARREIELAQKIGADIFTFGEEGYPEPLVNIYSPPPVIYMSGQWSEKDSTSIAVVGSRTPTGYGRSVAEKLVKDLTAKGLTIVSGLARGIDGVSHRAAIAANGRTIGVLGCGLNVYYPAEHRELQKKMAQHGAVISQFPITMGPDKMFFPMRNRVISGLSLGILVIEAAKKSGALITAYAALEDNREVFAVPGPVNSAKSEGTNQLIKKGHAKLVQNVDDILEELPEHIRKTLYDKQSELPLGREDPLSKNEIKIMTLVDHEEKHIDFLSGQSGLPSNSVSAILLALELKGKVKQLAGKQFVKI